MGWGGSRTKVPSSGHPQGAFPPLVSGTSSKLRNWGLKPPALGLFTKTNTKPASLTSYGCIRCCGVSLSWSWGGKGFETENYGEEESTPAGGANGGSGETPSIRQHLDLPLK